MIAGMSVAVRIDATAANGPAVLALPWGEMVILVVGLIALAAVIYVVVAALRGTIGAGRAVLAVLVALLIPVIGAVLVVWAVMVEAGHPDLATDRPVAKDSASRT